MATLRKITLNWEIRTGAITCDTGYIKRQELCDVDLRVTVDGAAYALDTGWALNFTVKPAMLGDNAALVQITSWTASATTGLYQATAQTMGSTALDTYLAANNADTTDDEGNKLVDFDVYYTIAAAMKAKSRTVNLICEPDVGRADDGSPTEVASPDDNWVAHGHAQTLTAGQKLQASTNLGLNLTASKLLGQAASGGTGLPVAITLGTGLSITGTTLNASGSGITINTTAITGGTIGNLMMHGADDVVRELTPGTGIITALGANVGSAGAPALFNGALGTPASGVATNLTGTAAGLTAGAASTIAVADETADATCFPLFATAANGNLAGKTNAGLTFNSSIGLLTVTSMVAGTLNVTVPNSFTLADAALNGIIVSFPDDETGATALRFHLGGATRNITFAESGTVLVSGGALGTPSSGTISGSFVTGGTFGAVNSSALTALNASNISSGTMADARNTVANSTTTSLTGAALAITPSTTGAINAMNIGATTRGTGAFTTLAANGATTFTAGTASTSGTTGTVVVTGGLGTSGTVFAALNVACGSSGAFYVAPDSSFSTFKMAFGSSSFNTPSGFTFLWSNDATNGSATKDTSLSRNAAGVLQIGTTAANASGSLALTNITASGALITTPEALAPALNAGITVSVATVATGFALNGVNAATLANGTNGQIKTIVCTAVTVGGTATLTPTTANGFTTVAFTAAGQNITLQYFSVGGWVILSVRGASPA